MDLITPKSLLLPHALERLDPTRTYRFCGNRDCLVAYFAGDETFTSEELKVPVFQKSDAAGIPVCYCFDWSPKRIAQEIATTGQSTASRTITAHVQAGRCACEVNNPQGSCCLGNVTQVVKAAQAGRVMV
ncbi:MAG: (2Fe-2S)-binding protein [Chloroflexi bacterium]|nr:(2Fe-2S)-binding protein [Chloroflexota bacterium]